MSPNPIPAMSPNPIPAISMKPDPDFSLKADYGDLIKSGAGRYHPKVIEEIIQWSIDLVREEAKYGDIIKSGEDPNDPKVMEVMIQRCVDLLRDSEGDEDIKPEPSKPSIDCIGCGPGGLYWPPDCPLKHTEEYDEDIAEIFSDLIDSKLHG